ncbi:hypothetical protein C8A03DRAFT_13553 [Achaetomium macrosporum]|uniref:Uncharacterized protein n=1 Tax=Achaetomium macrosporum TaxID=79813 RepID=A0AAN7CDK1_9PEZI|nr:hypothetical protein C8A03DRAFT_13553 [Achaetomium macrosporum]
MDLLNERQRHDCDKKLVRDSRQSQNRVGKRYRDKLGAEFESLQAALRMGCYEDDDAKKEGALTDVRHPVQLLGQHTDACDTRRSSTINKAKVLALARERISDLLQEWESVKAERDTLRQEKLLGGW